MADPAPLDLTDTELYRAGFPHAEFARLRREEPVRWQPAPPGYRGRDAGFWVLSRHADVVAANRNTELFDALDGPSLADPPEMRGTMLASMDGREHTRLRKLISAGFTPRMVARLEEQMRRWASRIVGDALERGTCDFVSDVAYQLPMHMIADILGVPVEDRGTLFRITSDFLQAADPTLGISPARQMELQTEMFTYGRDLGAEKRRHPRDDVWTILSTVEVEGDDGHRTALGELELDLFFLLLTIAGSETTRSAIAEGLLALLRHPAELEAIRSDPGLVPTAVEEILRWSSPVAYFARRATREVEIRGVRVAAGDRVTLWYPSANRDEEAFAEPERFDVRRDPNDHVAFGGGGPHFCLGANLARQEIGVLFTELLRRTRTIELLDEPRYASLTIHSPVLVAMRTMPVRLA